MNDTADEPPPTIGERLERIAEGIETGLNHDDVGAIVNVLERLVAAVDRLDGTIHQVAARGFRLQ